MAHGQRRVRRVLLIGVDGADPAVLEELMDAGRLPELARMRSGGAYAPMRTTYPPVSPVAWTSLLTGCWPARHGIIDFVTKAPHAYHPTLGLYSLRAGPDGQLRYESRRTVPTIADILSAEGLSSYLLHIPATFPPPEIRGGVLAGLGAPDLLGSFGVPALYASNPDALPPDLRGRPEVRPLSAYREGLWHGRVEGPGDTGVPLAVTTDGDAISLQVGGDKAQQRLAPKAWGDWTDVRFDRVLEPPMRGICRFCLLRLHPDILLYRTPLHHSPASPGVPICWPADFSSRLVDQVGAFPTASFPMEQAAYQDGLLSEDVFLAGAYDVWEQQVGISEALLTQNDWAFLAMHLFTADTLQHLFWPDIGGLIGAGYEWLDRIIGRLAAVVGPETLLFVVSDHGAAPLDNWVRLNTWLQGAGYLVLDGRGRIDWGQTQAFCLGYAGIYLNVAGREPAGAVEPGSTYRRLREEISGRLTSLRDPRTGRRVVQHAVPREAWNSGPHVEQMPDLIVALERGYGLARSDARGAALPDVPIIEPNRGRWRGGHEGPHAPDLVPGIFLSAGGDLRSTPLHDARIVDVAPTILKALGLSSPVPMDGRPLEALFT